MDKRTAICSVFVIIIVFSSIILLNSFSGKSQVAFNLPAAMNITDVNEAKEVVESQPENVVSENLENGDIKKVEDFSDIQFNRILYPGMDGEDVKKAQYILGNAGYYKGEVNGYFDESTKRAVILFQQDNNIYQTGNIGDMTQKSLNEIAEN